MLKKELQALLTPASVNFNEAEHVYQHKVTGEFYKGCTTIADSMEKPFLAPWYAKEMANEILKAPFDAVKAMTPPEFEKFVTNAKGAGPRIATKAKDDGTAAHDWFESWIKAKMITDMQLAPTPASKEANNAIEAFLSWIKQHEIAWLASEEVVSSDFFKVAGKLDALAIVDGIPSLIDFKTSSQISESYPLQCAGYHMMLEEMGFKVRQWIVIRTPKDGSPAETLTITDRDQMRFFQETFVNLIEAHKYQVFIQNNLVDPQTRKIKTEIVPSPIATVTPATGKQSKKVVPKHIK